MLDSFRWGVAIVVLALMFTIGTASADDAAGWKLPAQGDVAQAEAEWKANAAQGNVEAQFRLGELYEQVRGNYSEAEDWYTKAAERGSVQALYRLALIALAGNSEIAPDPVKAYKWAVLASNPDDQWGRLAEDLRSQLDAVLTAAERGDATRQAELWRQQRTGQSTILARIAPQRGEAPGASRAAAAPDREVKSGPCPPDSPEGTKCAVAPPQTEVPSKSPQLAVVTPPPAPSHPSHASDEKALAEAMRRVQCGSLRKTTNEQGRPVITGTVPDDSERSNLIRVSSALAPEHRPEIQVRVVPPPLCRSLSELDGFRTASLVADDLHARLNGSGATLREGDPISIEITAGDYPIDLRIDYLSLDGQVLHMLPNENTSVVRLAAGTRRIFGSGGGEDWRAGGPPFGTELILVIATPQPLDFGKRPTVEDAATYLSALEKGLRQRGAEAAKPNLLKTMLVETRAR
jgi:hypothetical protein